jgi:hypothetical protein
MIKYQENIEIGGVCCSIGFLDGFFEQEFSAILLDYKRWGFISEGNPEMCIIVKEGGIEAPHSLKEYEFYHQIDYDSVYATLAFDTRSFEGEIGFSIKRNDRFTPVRIIEMIETFIFNAYLFYFLLMDMGTFIHSCGIAEGMDGYIFAGPGGGGKSTVGKLSFPRTVICDDLVLLRKNKNGKRRMFGTPFFGDLQCVNKSLNCRALYFIEKSSSNAIIPISRMNAAVELMKEGVIGGFVSIPGIQDILSRSKMFYSIVDLLDGVPCFRIEFKKDNSFWELINGQFK